MRAKTQSADTFMEKGTSERSESDSESQRAGFDENQWQRGIGP